MTRDNVLQVRLSDSEIKVVEMISDEMKCSKAEAVRKCIRVTRVYSDDELLEMIQSEEFNAVTRLMGGD